MLSPSSRSLHGLPQPGVTDQAMAEHRGPYAPTDGGSRPNPDVPSALTVESEVTLLDGPPATKAEVTVCEVLSVGVIYRAGWSGPNG